MRLTYPLFRHGRMVRLIKDMWKAANKKRVKEDNVPDILLKMNVEIKDAKDVAEPVVELPVVKVSEPWNFCKSPPKHLKPNWKDRVCHLFMNETRLLEGLKQAQILTNTNVHEGLPSHIEELIGLGEQDNQDDLVKRTILQSQVLDGYQIRLPKSMLFNKYGRHLNREYGIPKKRQIELMLRNIIRTMELQTNCYTGPMERLNFSDTKVVMTTTKDNDLIQFKVKANALTMAKTPLAPFASPEAIAQLTDVPLPNIFPIKCTLDLQKTNNYEGVDYFSLRNPRDYHIHTIYIFDAQPKQKWSSSQRLSRALCVCYAFAVSQAKSQYGAEIKTLPRPVVLQCVQSDGREFSFLFYQLNTLNLDGESNERNSVWIQSDVPLYEQCIEQDRQIILQGYNSDVYENLLAMHMNGVIAEVKPTLTDIFKNKSFRLVNNVAN